MDHRFGGILKDFRSMSRAGRRLKISCCQRGWVPSVSGGGHNSRAVLHDCRGVSVTAVRADGDETSSQFSVPVLSWSPRGGSCCNPSLAQQTREAVPRVVHVLNRLALPVVEKSGNVPARASAEDWLLELMARDDLPTSVGQWRQVIVKVLARLASRVTAPSTPIARTLAYPG